jgi:hypothetical protein
LIIDLTDSVFMNICPCPTMILFMLRLRLVVNMLTMWAGSINKS